jgi:hypothetical protein
MKTAIIRMDTTRDGKTFSDLFTYGKIGSEDGDCVVEFDGEKMLSEIGDHVKFYFKDKDHVRVLASNRDDAVLFDFRKGPRVECLSDGQMININVTTQQINSTMDENGGELNLKYTMAFHHMLSSENEIHLVAQAVKE